MRQRAAASRTHRGEAMVNRVAIDVAPDIYKAAFKLQEAVEATGLKKHYAELIKIRASQINGCAYCINLHTREARKLGMSEWKIYLLSAWRESTVFDEKERAVLAWTEALTRVSERGAAHELYAELVRHFSELEVVGINTAVAMINYWNRVTIGFGTVHPTEKELR
jgi:AhpD family alkylhydroperoxidase